jgi:hypothetical protein
VLGWRFIAIGSLVLCSLQLVTTASAQIEARFTSSRESGCVAPCAVYFDARGTALGELDDAERFRDLTYLWSFSDPDSGRWSNSGVPKNAAVGALAGHVFEQPGTYVVRLNVYDGKGATGAAETSVEVTDPNDVFVGTDTMCFSTGSDFTGCPGGCSDAGGTSRCATETNLDTILSAVATGTRTLLRRGDSWSGASRHDLPDGPVLLGAFGDPDSPRPVLDVGQSEVFIFENAQDVRVVDLAFEANHGDEIKNFADSGTGITEPASDILFLRVSGQGFNAVTSMVSGVLPNWDWKTQRLFFVDCHFTCRGNCFNNVVAEQLVVMGGSYGPTPTHDQHIMRFRYSAASVFQHMRVLDPGLERVNLVRIQAPAFGGESGVPPGQYNQDIIFSDNVVVGGKALQLMEIAPQNPESDERIRRVIVERNLYLGSSEGETGTVAMLKFSASQGAVRNNVFDGQKSLSMYNGGLSASDADRPGLPIDDNRFDNNTCYSSQPEDEKRCIIVKSGMTNTLVRNNLFVAPNGRLNRAVDISAAGEGSSESNNVITTMQPFREAIPAESDLQSFDLKGQANGARDRGIVVPSVLLDAALRLRPMTGAYDVGAFEAGADPAPFPGQDGAVTVTRPENGSSSTALTGSSSATTEPAQSAPNGATTGSDGDAASSGASEGAAASPSNPDTEPPREARMHETLRGGACCVRTVGSSYFAGAAPFALLLAIIGLARRRTR